MIRPAIQLYTLRTVDESIGTKLDRIAETNYRGVEFAGLADESPTAVASKLEEVGVDAVGAHVGVETLETEYADVVERYGTLGCSRLVVPSYDTDAFGTRDGVDAAADRLSELADRFDADGFELMYHNHTFEFESLGSNTAMDRFVERTSDLVRLEIDTGLANQAGADPIDLLERHADRVSLLHLTDSRSGSERTAHVDLGEGEVDVRACLETARDVGVEWAIYENGTTTDPLGSLAHSDARLSTLIRG